MEKDRYFSFPRLQGPLALSKQWRFNSLHEQSKLLEQQATSIEADELEEREKRSKWQEMFRWHNRVRN